MKNLAGLFFLLLLTSCADPLPDSQNVFVGLWKSNQTSLLITKGGRLEYETHKGSVKTSISMPIKTITDSEVVAGFLFFNSSFTIQGKPQQENGLTVLIVDGEKLFKADEQGNVAQVLKLPDMKAIRLLVTNDLNLLDASMKNKDFTKYIESASLQFQSQFTNQKLLELYQGFFAKKINLKRWMEGQFILIKEPAIDSDGVLSINGRYPTEPNSLKFTVNFVYSDQQWKSIGPDLNINKNK